MEADYICKTCSCLAVVFPWYILPSQQQLIIMVNLNEKIFSELEDRAICYTVYGVWPYRFRQSTVMEMLDL